MSDGDVQRGYKSIRLAMSRCPSEARLRAAQLEALGQRDSHLPDFAVGCSQHFLLHDMCETESVPSTVLVCMICLDTESKMILMTNYNLRQAYEKLTGYPLGDGGNLKQTLCVQCAQRLRNFSRFREQSLRAHSLMMELLEKHELITTQHIKMIKHANNQLKSNLGTTILGPNLCDMHIVENFNEDRLTDSEETVHEVTVKIECSDNSQLEDAVTQVINDESSNADCVSEEFDEDLMKYESAVFMCAVCCEEFLHEHAYSAHVSMHLHDTKHPSEPSAHTIVGPLSEKIATDAGIEVPSTEEADTTQTSEQALVTGSHASDLGPGILGPEPCNMHIVENFNEDGQTDSEETVHSDDRTLNDIKSCVVKLYDILKYPQNAKVKVESSPQTLQAVSYHDVLNAHTACKDAQYHAASEDEVSNTHKPAASVLSETEPSIGNTSHTCDVCQNAFTQKDCLCMHMKIHTGEKSYSCKICSYKTTQKSLLVRHMRTHTGEKPYSCKLCNYKCTVSCNLKKHMRIHTGEKPYSCKICDYKCTVSGSLLRHMRIHTGERPYSCKICSYKFTQKGCLVNHMRRHTGEKPFSCKICDYKCTIKARLVTHMRNHTGEKPYSCDICAYKFTQKVHLVSHMRTHTGEKPYSCDICAYKFTQKVHLVSHMRTHTGEKPYYCKICGYKFTQKGHLVIHIRTHSGKKP